MKELQLRNLQRDRTIDRKRLRSIITALLEELLNITNYELAIHFVSERRIAEMNQRFLGHEGPTDVITFDFRDGYATGLRQYDLAGEIYTCVRVAERQAKEFTTSFQAELVRYVVHGVLHLLGYDDLEARKRQRMKREEDHLVKALERRFDVMKLAR